ncbi:ABC transporter permease, partial [Nonomuraea sp. RK-328]|nr:ABC transporter permease [Nonomuraea sp. RK-328]
VPGDPARSILGVRASAEKVAALRQQLGLDRPLWEQLGSYVGGVLHGDLGTSVSQPGQSVTGLLGGPLLVTLQVVAVTTVISVVVGSLTGLSTAGVVSRRWKNAADVLSTTTLAVPSFLLGLLLLMLVSDRLGLAPAGGWGTGWPDNTRYVWLPALALSAYLASLVHRAVYTSAVACRRESFVEAALLRGVTPRRVALAHVLPNSLLAAISIVSMNFGALIGGAAVIEAVFDIPGIGTQLVEAVSQRDYPTIQGAVLITAFAVIIANAAGDLLYRLCDPRTRSS